MVTRRIIPLSLLLWLTLGAFTSCGPQADLLCQTPLLNWMAFYDPKNPDPAVPFCSDFEVAETLLVDRFSDLYSWDNRLTKEHVGKRLRDVRIVIWPGPYQGAEGMRYSGLAVCPTHSVEIGNTSIPSSAFVHEMLHIAQGCWGQKENLLKPENYPGSDWGTTGHGGWIEDGFYGRIDAINQSLREAISQ